MIGAREKFADMFFLPVFLCGFFLTIFTGLPFLPIIIIWEALYGSVIRIIVWSISSGILWGFIVGNMIWWGICFGVGGFFLYSARTLMFRKITFTVFIAAIFFLLIFLFLAGINKPADTSQQTAQQKFYAIDAKIQIPSIEITQSKGNSFIVLPDTNFVADLFLLTLLYVLCLYPFYARVFQKKQSYS